MQIDRKNLDALLSLNDRQLTSIIGRIVRESGIDPAMFNIDPANVASIRKALSVATDRDIEEIMRQYNERKGGGGK